MSVSRWPEASGGVPLRQDRWTMSREPQPSLATLRARIREILPAEYQDSYEDIQPVSMGSAGLKYAADGKVAWDEIWGSFCDLAMAGGPPHKGMLLEPGSPAEIAADPERYGHVVAEICRGVTLVTGLAAAAAPAPGWVRVQCPEAGMAEWLVRAITMENVSVRWGGTTIDLPAGPDYRVAKEIKNVITSIAKTHHYWDGHMMPAQNRSIARLFAEMTTESPLVQPALPGDDQADEQQRLCSTMAEAIHEATGLPVSRHAYAGWLGLDCRSVAAAIWMMRALVASNVLSRREDAVLFVPVNPGNDPAGTAVARAVIQVHGFAAAENAL